MADGGVGAAGLALAVPGVIELCIKYGHSLKQKIKAFRHIREIARLDEFIVELVQGELHVLLTFFASIHGSQPPEDQTRLLFDQLRSLLENIVARFPAEDPNTWDKIKFAFHGKNSLDNACTELEQWYTRFLRRVVVFLVFGGPGTLAAGPNAAAGSQLLTRIQRIRKTIQTPASGPDAPRLQLEAYESSVTLRQLGSSSVYALDTGGELVEYRTYNSHATPQEISTTKSLIRDFAASLHETDPSIMGLLRCKGFSAEPLSYKFGLRFQYPAGKTEPHTLQQLLTHASNQSSGGVRHSMSDRIALARKLASAVLYMHSCGFVHKNIRPENILIFDCIAPEGTSQAATSYPNVVGEPFLVGFDSVRKATAASNMIRVEEWRKIIYLHPDRHRMEQGDEFTMRHDVYSLGVVLLEISLWDTFTNKESRYGKYLWRQDQDGLALLAPDDLRNRYLGIARSLVHRVLGDKYRDVVVSCLEGLKDEEEGGLLDDQDGIVVGSAYISQVMSKLEEICL